LHLCLAWSLDEPARVGELVPILGPTAIGRGGALSDDPAPRGEWVRLRPGETTVCPPLANARISRLHLVVEPVAGPGVRVRAVGRAPMRVNGVTVEDTVVREGDVVELHNAAVFLVVERQREMPPLASPFPTSFDFSAPDPFGFVGESETAWKIRDALTFAAATDRHVLIHGDSGVGKELAARSIHGLSSRRARPFVSRNAATMPEALVDAELFGNAKSYPNPGMAERPGLIGEAHESTLFLDEIGELPETQQVHLLRVLDGGGEYQRLGDPQVRRSAFRLIGATNRPLEELKHDFLARFVHRIEIPGLDARREDIPLLIDAILRANGERTPAVTQRFFERRDGQIAEPCLAPDFVARTLRHPFTHHARELERLLWLAMSSAEADFIGVTKAVDEQLRDATPTRSAQDIDRATLVEALDRAGGSPTKAARALDLKNRYVILRLMKKHGVNAGDDEEEAD
jgi:two-component system nitrogen regulation response regulator GlnG/two-component system response regulator HydG